jgi:hypothetical protein
MVEVCGRDVVREPDVHPLGLLPRRRDGNIATRSFSSESFRIASAMAVHVFAWASGGMQIKRAVLQTTQEHDLVDTTKHLPVWPKYPNPLSYGSL